MFVGEFLFAFVCWCRNSKQAFPYFPFFLHFLPSVPYDAVLEIPRHQQGDQQRGKKAGQMKSIFLFHSVYVMSSSPIELTRRWPYRDTLDCTVTTIARFGKVEQDSKRENRVVSFVERSRNYEDKKGKVIRRRKRSRPSESRWTCSKYHQTRSSPNQRTIMR
jgi:hypothetical protein